MDNVQGRSSAMSAMRAEGARTIGVLAAALVMLSAVAGVVVWTGTEKDEPTVTAPPAVQAPAPVVTPAALHADVYFDFKSTRLGADAAAVLQQQALHMSRGGDWAVLVHGYADRHGPAVYNRTLAERRAETVKRFLVELGVPEASVKVVTVGQDGALCDDPAPECQRLNRRVHLEMRRLHLPQAMPVRPAADAIVEH